MRQKTGKGKTSVTGKRPDLSGSSSYFADAAGRQTHDDDRYHEVGQGEAASSIVESLNKWIASFRSQDALNVAKSEDQGDGHDKAHDGIQRDRQHDGFWQRGRSVFDLLGCVGSRRIRKQSALQAYPRKA
jgi:hypothetical protein